MTGGLFFFLMTTNNNLGFGGQWVEIFRAGRHKPLGSDAVRDFPVSFLESAVRNFNPSQQEVPITCGSPIHPLSDAPAYGLATSLKVEGESLLAQFSDVDPEVEDLVRSKKLLSRSASFYDNPPRVKHVHFLGIQPAAVKGLKQIHFSEGETITVEFSEGATMSTEKQPTDEQVDGAVKKFLKEKFPSLFGDDKPATAQFSEGDRKKILDDAVAAARAAFSEELKKATDKVDELQKQVDAQTGNSNRGAVVSFCDDMIAKGKLTPAIKPRVVNLMDALAALPADKKVTVISFAENGDEKKTDNTLLVEFQEFIKAMPAFIQFGEGFASLKATGDGSEIVNQKQKDAMRGAMGLGEKKTATA